MAVNFRENLMLGIDWTRPIGGAGFWFEAAQVFAGALNTAKRDSEKDFFRATIGADYSLRNGTYLYMEYHYNGAGSNDIREWIRAILNNAYMEASGYLFGKHYLVPGVGYQLTPLVILNGQILANLSDPSLFIMSTVEYNIAENIYLSGGAYFGSGASARGTIYRNDDFAIGWGILNSEFGIYPDFYFTSFRIYF